jgi:hypothetical protein
MFVCSVVLLVLTLLISKVLNECGEIFALKRVKLTQVDKETKSQYLKEIELLLRLQKYKKYAMFHPLQF